MASLQGRIMSFLNGPARGNWSTTRQAAQGALGVEYASRAQVASVGKALGRLEVKGLVRRAGLIVSWTSARHPAEGLPRLERDVLLLIGLASGP